MRRESVKGMGGYTEPSKEEHEIYSGDHPALFRHALYIHVGPAFDYMPFNDQM